MNYLVPATDAHFELKERGSRFIATLCRISAEKDAAQVLAQLKSEHPKPNHICYAWRLAPDGAAYRLNDDGEPAGSAGLPILNVLLSCQLVDALVTVTRYFGGTLLGVPGLIQAYSSSARGAIDAGGTVELIETLAYNCRVEYKHIDKVKHWIKTHPLTAIAYEEYREVVELSINLPIDEFQTNVEELQPWLSST